MEYAPGYIRRCGFPYIRPVNTRECEWLLRIEMRNARNNHVVLTPGIRRGNGLGLIQPPDRPAGTYRESGYRDARNAPIASRIATTPRRKKPGRRTSIRCIIIMMEPASSASEPVLSSAGHRSPPPRSTHPRAGRSDLHCIRTRHPGSAQLSAELHGQHRRVPPRALPH